MKTQNVKTVLMISLVILTGFLTSGCMRYLTHDRSEVLLDGINVDQTLEIAKAEIAREKFGASLTIWVIRDQVFTAEQAKKVSVLYFRHVRGLKNFDTWAIANIYRHGNEGVKEVLLDTYVDAARRARNLSNIADRMANGGNLYMGDAHGGGRAYAHKHVIVPGNEDYLQSVEDYSREKNRKNSND